MRSGRSSSSPSKETLSGRSEPKEYVRGIYETDTNEIQLNNADKIVNMAHLRVIPHSAEVKTIPKLTNIVHMQMEELTDEITKVERDLISKN